MNSIEDYRIQAEDCLRMALTAPDEQDKPLWATLAQSWLRLAQEADRIKSGLPAAGNDPSGDSPAAH